MSRRLTTTTTSCCTTSFLFSEFIKFGKKCLSSVKDSFYVIGLQLQFYLHFLFVCYITDTLQYVLSLIIKNSLRCYDYPKQLVRITINITQFLSTKQNYDLSNKLLRYQLNNGYKHLGKKVLIVNEIHLSSILTGLLKVINFIIHMQLH